MDVFSLPPGFRFTPIDEEIINYFLQKKHNGETLPLPHNGYVIDRDLYGDKEPWMIFNKDLKQNFYVFTSLKNINGKRIKRSAGCGTWDTQKTDYVKNRKGQLIGFKKLLVFEAHRSVAVGKGRWIMHEFSIGKDDKCVLCRIRNKDWDKHDPPARVINDSETVDARKRGRDDQQVDGHGPTKRVREDEHINGDANFCTSMAQGTANIQQLHYSTVYEDASCMIDHDTINQGFYQHELDGGTLHASNSSIQNSHTNSNIVHDDEESDWLNTLLLSFRD